mmetsp:Transcript_4136/g.15576  ORF Transcript_4136/g.15576 Transcript_4136/m.15576 type:complete len:95 (-) Transcript_4136:192-476(-)
MFVCETQLQARVSQNSFQLLKFKLARGVRHYFPIYCADSHLMECNYKQKSSTEAPFPRHFFFDTRRNRVNWEKSLSPHVIFYAFLCVCGDSFRG